ncbi:class V aminotransferase [Dehalococcoides mccartyi]|jgi:aspartate aminotransferase-like enzyme|uniref:pyridoxal-phosphate-dependent aminotransferase family protein n=1 Tax=Dehalococcoides mccartyi TaxID=61435 RepID=UPI0004E08906|nr:alanine--glyoxylate aminotransferase family protein [Dehalococcoides mccartyi]AII57740.1 class V aminotransferase [Dehalococcoides mccartyi CG1]APH12222.1 class V aminotransferase [Dehalococcoides mccartyi]
MQNLRIPGPTPCPEEVLTAMGQQMINHRGPEMAAIMKEVAEKLKYFFQTKNDVLVLTGSGTGGLEAAAVNFLSPGETVLSVSIGVFGERFAKIASIFGAKIIALNFEHGKAADPALVKKALMEHPEIKAVLVTHNETSTGITNDLKSLAAVVKGAGKLLLVDAISSLSSIDLPVDEWGCDVVVSGSQKGWMVPPGLAFISVSPDAWKANAESKMPRFYWDLAKHKASIEKGQTPWTPCVSVIVALHKALIMMEKEGMQNIFKRHQKIADFTRKGVKELGLTLLAEEKYASNTVTAVLATEGLDPKKLLKVMREEYNTVLAGGQGPLEGKIFRIGHLGWVTENDIKVTLDNLKSALPKAGFRS